MESIDDTVQPDWYKIGVLFIADTGARVNEAVHLIKEVSVIPNEAK